MSAHAISTGYSLDAHESRRLSAVENSKAPSRSEGFVSKRSQNPVDASQRVGAWRTRAALKAKKA